VLTHLFGGSAGREGTAVQMGGALAHGVVDWLPWLSRYDIRIVLMSGIAAGFGGVFGTPVAGAVFALEVLVIGRMNYLAIFPCLVASIVADQTTIFWGAHHTHYHIASIVPEGSELHSAPLDLVLWGWVILAGALFGLTSLLFAATTHQVSAFFKRFVGHPVLRPIVGGGLLIGMVWLVGTRDYLGLGVRGEFEDSITITRCFQAGGAVTFAWLLKLVFTSVTLGSGFKGGEVTPLFFIGAALGNTLALWWGLPVDLLAALGFVAVFAGATNTPLACTIMAVELFGSEYLTYFATACFMAYLLSGPSGIYASQKLGIPKHPGQWIGSEQPDLPPEKPSSQ
jgi:H+/Cl- antiporter ClcA